MTTPQESPDALQAEMAEVAGQPATFTMFDTEWQVLRKPPALMVARLGRIDENDPEAIGVLDQLIEHALGKEQHKTFINAYYAASPDDGDDSGMLQDVMTAIFSASLGRPTS